MNLIKDLYIDGTFQNTTDAFQINGVAETARKHNLHYQILKNWVDAHSLHWIEGLQKPVLKPYPELKR